MDRFAVAHAAHPDWQEALRQATARLRPQLAGRRPTLGWLYFSDHYADHAHALMAALRASWPDPAWVGCVGVGVAANGTEHFDEPALALMLCDLPPGQFRVFSGARPLTAPLARFAAHTALVHADANTPDLPELIQELSGRTGSGYLFGGLAASRGQGVQVADGVLSGALSGVAFSRDVALLSRVTQGCQPIGPARQITAAQRNVVSRIDGEPALDVLFADLGLRGAAPKQVLPLLRDTLAGLSDPGDAPFGQGGQFGSDTRVRHILGIDPGERAVALAEQVAPGMRLAFCQRDMRAARRDLVRICTEIREEVETPAPSPAAVPQQASPPAATAMLGALYVSCAGRGGPHFGAPSAELAIVRQALGDVPLVGFFAGGEIARHHLYGYTGVLTVFTGRA
ncbi:MAG TPA: FIST N-terminal domain-containing protein [Burkholderiaceae bacterium]|nr:FIST N-terminal domain-containing protein [Burkholderiaceae bacterium]